MADSVSMVSAIALVSTALVGGIALSQGSGHTDSFSTFFQISGMLFDAEDMSNFLVMKYRDTEVTEVTTATYENEIAIGRTTPIYTYSHTTPRTINISTYFIGDWWPMVQVKRKADWLKTFLYPRDNGLAIKPPKEVLLMLGFYLGIRGVVTNVSVTHNYGGAPPWGISVGSLGTISMYSTVAKVDITIQETSHFWTGGQITYDETVKDSNFRLSGVEMPGIANSVLNLL